MRNYAMILALFVFVGSAQAAEKGGFYLGAGYAVSKSSSTNSLLDAISGSTIAAQFGKRTSDAFALELMFRSTSFKAAAFVVDYTAVGAGVVTINTQPKSLFVGPGFRWFLFKYINLHGGAGYVSTQTQMTTTNATVAALLGATTTSGFGFYYGGGLQLPLGKVDVFGDYTMATYGSDLVSGDILGGLRLYF